MPGGNRTGPVGTGPMTGRRAGFCAGFAIPGFANNNMGRGSGLGRGGGRSWYTGRSAEAAFANSWGIVQPGNPNDVEEIEFLQNRSKQLKQELKQIQKRLEVLENNSTG